MVWVKIFHFWPDWKWKSVISCQNEKTVRQIFCMLQSTWECIRKSKRVGKMLREKLVIFALDPKVDQAILTLFLTSAPTFLWLVVHFDKKIWFWYETEIVPENSCSGIWSFSQIHTLKAVVLLRFYSNIDKFKTTHTRVN